MSLGAGWGSPILFFILAVEQAGGGGISQRVIEGLEVY